MNAEGLNELDIIIDRHLIWIPGEGTSEMIKDNLRETLIEFINGITIDILSHAAAEVYPGDKILADRYGSSLIRQETLRCKQGDD